MSKTAYLKLQRKSLFDKWLNIKSSEDYLLIQERIAEDILNSEQELKESNEDEVLQFHISRLRLYADGLAWISLHPHAIRQMAKNPGPAPSLQEQRESYNQVLKSAKRNLKKYHAPVLICDITNILRIGDLIICVNPDCPIIVECKNKLSKPEHLMQGRTGRQISRAEKALQYLNKGTAKSYGKDLTLHTIESPHKAERNWEILSKVCGEAVNANYARHNVSSFETIWAYTPDYRTAVISEVSKYGDRTAYFGTTAGLMNMTDGLFPPPIVWPIPSTFRFSILEGDIEIAHLVDSKAFEQDFCTGGNIEIHPTETSPIHVRIGNNVYNLALRFIYDVLYGFETVASCVNGLISFANQIQSLDIEKINRTPTEKPSINHISSIDEAMRLVNSGIEKENSLVSISVPLLEMIKNRTEAIEWDIIETPSYAILDWQTFKQLMSKYTL